VRALDERVVDAVRRHPSVRSVELVGSRAEGRASERSDWDFRVAAHDFAAVGRDLGALLEPLEPIAQQWDRLSVRPCWMLMLAGPVKIDLIFAEEVHEPEPPWLPAPENLTQIDAHFWDWILWLASKEAAGRDDVVTAELQRLHDHLLAPLGVERPPESVHDAIEAYRGARASAEARFGVHVPRRLEAEVARALDS
jgi:predicted nucleotidyltransferase